MRRQHVHQLLPLLLSLQHAATTAASGAGAAAPVGGQQQQQQRQPGFSIHQDLLAYPQFEVVLSEAFIFEADAQALLDKAEARSSRRAARSSGGNGKQHAAAATDLAPGSGRGDQHDTTNERDDNTHDDNDDEDNISETYEVMSAPPHKYLCAIPVIEAAPAPNKTATELAKAEEAKELARASAHGSDLVNELEGECLHYMLGWWSYTFCYGQSVVQFHALPGSMKIGAPVRDPQTMEYVLGRVGGRSAARQRLQQQHQQQQQQQREGQMNGDVEDPAAAAAAAAAAMNAVPQTPPAKMEMQVKGDQRYMMQRLDEGTVCDLTGRDRTIEIQYHCSPGATTDRISWIKEVTTCAYLMVVHTPRLCDDVAFVPPKETKANIITCRDIIPEEGLHEWSRRKMIEVEDMLIGRGRGGVAGNGGGGKGAPVTIGGIVVGGRKTFGNEVPRLAPPRGIRQANAAAAAQVVKVVAKGSGGKDKSFEVLSDEDLAQLGIDAETISQMREDMKKVAGEKEWKVELIDVGDEDDTRALRGVVMDDVDEGQAGEEVPKRGSEKKKTKEKEKEKAERGQKVADGAEKEEEEVDDEGSEEQFYQRQRDEL